MAVMSCVVVLGAGSCIWVPGSSDWLWPFGTGDGGICINGRAFEDSIVFSNVVNSPASLPGVVVCNKLLSTSSTSIACVDVVDDGSVTMIDFKTAARADASNMPEIMRNIPV